MDEPTGDTAPVIEQDFSYGVKVVDIGDLRIARGLTRRRIGNCRHVHLVYDVLERRVFCHDCESAVEGFDAFVQLVERYDQVEKRIAALREMELATVHSRAAQAFDKVFRGRRMAPLCPHCKQAIMPEDVVSGLSTTSRELECARRLRAKGASNG